MSTGSDESASHQGVRLRAEASPGEHRTGSDAADLDQLVACAAAVAGGLKAAIELTRQVSDLAPQPGGGRSRERWELLASLGAGDLTAARIAEAHLDALAILAEAGLTADVMTADVTTADVTDTDRPTEVWGVYAAEAPGLTLQATADPRGGWSLTATKPWCSAAGALDRALVTAHTPEGRRLFAVRLDTDEVSAREGTWHSRGLAEVVSGPVDFDAAPATPVGETGWYLRRPGFAWGGIGVAACWYGGAVAVGRQVWRHTVAREPDQIALMHLGEIDRALEASRRALGSAAAAIDGPGGVADPALLAARVRGQVAAGVDTVLLHAGHAMGPAPLTGDEEHARRVADLQVYVRQHHGERDTARVGQLLTAASGPSW